jgi:hypothetical protein
LAAIKISFHPQNRNGGPNEPWIDQHFSFATVIAHGSAYGNGDFLRAKPGQASQHGQ